MAVINQPKKNKEYKENVDTLVTFGEEAYTMRKDDPRTEEAIQKSQELKEAKMKELIKNGASVFEGLNMSDEREENEDFQEYKARRATNNNLRKIYKKLGPEECRKQFPMGFNYALQQAVLSHQEEAIKQQPTATITNEDGSTTEAKVIINNDKK
tara:strand:- start:629 stop:1093 length:465 start_codon:yes stop_codon:yes gene_type:complete